MPSTVADTAARLRVAVAAIVNGNGEVLLSRRADHVHQGGLWEFPGGKLEPGENVQQALEREIREELGIGVGRARPLIRIHHDYPDLAVSLEVWRVADFSGSVQAREGQPIEWVPIEHLRERAFPEANAPIIQALQLPSRYLITPDPNGQPDRFLLQLENRLRQGIRLVQFRAPSLGAAAYAQLAGSVVVLCRRYDAQVLLNATPETVMRSGAHGLHLNSKRLQSMTSRPLAADFLVMASCHSPEQLARAAAVGVDAAVLSPVQATASHPDAEPLGWPRFADWVEPCRMSVYALGGMQESDVSLAYAHGGQGVAAIRALWEPV